MTEAIFPGSSTLRSLISFPLAETAFRASSNLIIPAAMSAPYSPSEWPITISGETPRRSSSLYMLVSAVSIEG